MIKPERLRPGDKVAIVSLSIGILPYGLRYRLDADRKTLTLLEPATQ